MRILVAFGDSEGTPHVKSNNSELWNLALIFKYVLSDDGIEEEIFHTTHLTINKNADKAQIKDPLQTHFKVVEYIRNMYECDRVHVGFWNAPHDMAVLNSYGKYPITAIDLLSNARKQNKDLDTSFNIGNLCRKFNIKENNTDVHTGLGDVLRMIRLIPYLNLDIHKVMFNQANTKQHVDKKIIRRRGIGIATEAKKSNTTTTNHVIRRHAWTHPRAHTDEIANLAIALARKLKV